jgi:flavin-dependent dehydrogenase
MTDGWPLVAEVDVCIVGAGSAGSSAAIAAARGGAFVLLIDRLPLLGGTSTAAAMATAGSLDPRDVPIEALRDRLRADGAILELPATVGA